MEINKENYDNLKAQKLTRGKIAEVFGIPEWRLKKLIAREGWGRKIPKYEYNNCFIRDTAEAAYWLGFLFADGCVDHKGRVRLMLQDADERHIEKFRSFVGAEDYTIQQCSGYTRKALEFTSKEACKDLSIFGILPNKTLKSIIPDQEVFGEHLNSFLRGLFDGDGTICESFSNANSITATLYTGFAIAKQNMEWLDNVLTNIVGVSYKVYEKDNIYTVTLNTNKSIRLLEYMYTNSTESTRLDRKYEMYNNIVLQGNRKTR
ncbi:hypothetical protein PR1_122 [Providencia phage vB_PreS_PR1]|uniref:Uncharacterized protein n=1 Tax=Providencia phage vB_PreS_PR1 TaxID=1931407 RepID=A0A1S6KUY9_9CAUD|nr:endonuclease [Providencia phage vB_PreS_PR1]AQT25235.1 hypothetical protein PR1_122 [Providencia phage vB_PreS_PR1]